MWMLHVVVVGSWLCSPPSVGSVSRLARAGGQNTTGPRGQNMRATPALPILHLDSAVSIKTT